MKKKRWSRLLALLLVLGLSVSLLTGCGAESTEAAASKEDAETIQVYLWTTNLYDTYAPYIQSQLPDVNIEFIVGISIHSCRKTAVCRTLSPAAASRCMMPRRSRAA